MTIKKKLLLSLLLVFGVFSMFMIPSQFSADTTWKELGDGNLKNVLVNGETYMVSDREDLINTDGARVFGYKTINGLQSEHNNYSKQNLEVIEIPFQLPGDKQSLTSIRLNGSVVTSEAKIDISEKQSKVLYDLGDGIFISNLDGTDLKEISTKEKKEFRENAILIKSQEELDTVGETGWWAIETKWAGEKIAFMSNRDVFPRSWYTSIWLMEADGSFPIKVIDGVSLKEDLNLLYADANQLIAYGGLNRLILRYDLKSQKVTQYNLNAVPFSVSKDGNYILSNGVDSESTLISDISILNLTTGERSTIDLPDNYQIFNGAWNASNSKFAFYSRDYRNTDTSLYYVDILKLTSSKVTTPKKDIQLNEVGAISWPTDDQVVVSTKKSVSWEVRIQ